MATARNKKSSEARLPPLPRTQLFLALVASDRTFERSTLGAGAGARAAWRGRCLHCRAPLWVDARGNPGPGVTLEHIVPSSLGGGSGADNLALACARCNQQKGSRMDVLGLANPRLRALVDTLQAQRRARWREPPAGLVLSPEALRYLEVGRPPSS